jgi:hypothetical protein
VTCARMWIFLLRCKGGVMGAPCGARGRLHSAGRHSAAAQPYGRQEPP